MQCNYSIFFFFCAIGVIAKKLLQNSMLLNFPPLFSSKSFIIWLSSNQSSSQVQLNNRNTTDKQGRNWCSSSVGSVFTEVHRAVYLAVWVQLRYKEIRSSIFCNTHRHSFQSPHKRHAKLQESGKSKLWCFLQGLFTYSEFIIYLQCNYSSFQSRYNLSIRHHFYH